MPQTITLPSNKRTLGDTLSEGLHACRTIEMASAYVQSMAVRSYLEGDRHFEIHDPYDTNKINIIVDIPPDAPAWEALVSDTSLELGRQIRVDETPVVTPIDLSLDAARDAAVARGMLAYLFPPWVTRPALTAAQKYRIEDGFCGLVVSPTIYPQRGWGLRIDAVPMEEIGYLPFGPRTSYTDIEMLAWSRWMSLTQIRAAVQEKSIVEGVRIALPGSDSDDYKRMEVLSVPYGTTPYDFILDKGGLPSRRLQRWGGSMYSSSGMSRDKDQKAKREMRMARFSQVYVTSDLRHVERCIWMVGCHVVWDKTYLPMQQPMLPMGITTYATVGGPRGRSFCFPKMMAALDGERVKCRLSRNIDETDVYGWLLFPGTQGIDLQSVNRAEGGHRTGTYNPDAGAPTHTPLQFKPVDLGRAYAGVVGLMMGLRDTVYPQSPILTGQTSGREDSEVAIRRLDILSNVQIAGGAETLARAFGQVYAAGLEMAAKHYGAGDTIPLTYISEKMAGILLETDEQPKSVEDEAQAAAMEESRAAGSFASGIDPGLEAMMGAMQGSGQLSQDNRIPLPRFKIGPNTIPHPDRANIGIASIMPRDKGEEYGRLNQALAEQKIGLAEFQIRANQEGLADIFPVGGDEVWLPYQLAVLNLLSVYGNGVESGPMNLPRIEYLGDPMIGYWVVTKFISSIYFTLASKTVQNKLVLLQGYYLPMTTPDNVPSAEEAAIAQGSVMRNRMAMAQRQAGAAGPPRAA